MNLDVEFFNKKFNVSRETIEKLKKYKDFLLISNKSLNLIGKTDRKSTRLNSSHIPLSRMPSSA